jgi:hypothetical protein
MLHSYQAELNGSQLIWIDQPPASITHRRVLVVVEDAGQAAAANAPLADAFDAFLRAEGCLGAATRAQIDADLAALRAEWDRPLGLKG